MFRSSRSDDFHVQKKETTSHHEFTRVSNLGAKISTQDVYPVYTRPSAPTSARASPWSNRSYFIYQKECRSLPKHGNLMVGWVAAGAWFKPIEREILVWAGPGGGQASETTTTTATRTITRTTKNNKSGVAVQPLASPARRDLHTSFWGTPHSDFCTCSGPFIF